MVKLLAYIRVIRFEGTNTLTSCEIFQDSTHLECLLPIVSEKRIKLVPESKYQVLAESGNSQFSVSFSSGLFEEDGMYWLPLFNQPCDYIEAQPEEVNPPRVLILVHKKLVEEGKSNLVTEESAIDYEFMPEIKLDYSENTTIIHEAKEGSPENSPIKDQFSSQTDDKILFTDKETDDQLLTMEHSADKMLEISVYYQESLNTHKKFTEKILEEIDGKNQQLALALNEISQLKTQVQRYEVENNYLRTMANGFIGVQISELVEQLEAYKEKLKLAESQKICSPIEETLKVECEKLGIKDVIRDVEEVYVMNGKKMNLVMRNGKVYCRVGGSYKEFRQVVMESNSENKPVVHNQSKSPFRKNLGEINSSVETPRGIGKGNESGKFKKAIAVQRPKTLKKFV